MRPRLKNWAVIGRNLALAMCLVGVPLASTAPMAGATSAAADAPAVVTQVSQHVLVAEQAPALMPARNRNCGWGITTQYHSCELARNLTFEYLYWGQEKYLEDVYSPNSGNYYDFWCSGRNRVTCTSSYGKVFITLRLVPAFRDCGLDDYDDPIMAWGSASCTFAHNTANAYEDQMSTMVRVYDPRDRRRHWMECYSDSPVVCFNNRSWVFIG